MNQPDVIIGIGGAAGDGVASAGNTLAVSVARQGQAVFAYNSYQSVIRGGHSWLRLRISAKKPLNHGDQVDAVDRVEPGHPGPPSAGAGGRRLGALQRREAQTAVRAPQGRAALPIAGPRVDARLREAADHAEHRGRRRRDSSDGAGFRRPGVGAPVDVRQEAAGRRGERGRGKGRLRLRCRPFQAAGQAAPENQPEVGADDGQRADGHGRGIRRLQVLLRVSDEPRDAHPGMVCRSRQGAWHLRPPGRGRDFCHQHVHRGRSHGRAEHVRDLRGRPGPDDRGDRHGRHDRNACGGRERDAGGSLHRRADEDRTGGSEPGLRREPGRLPTHRHRPAQHARLLQDTRAWRSTWPSAISAR